VWRQLYVVRNATPVEAADEADVYYQNFIRRPPWAPRKR
jgi:hypothetical protein